MSADVDLTRLRAPFPPELVGKLPRVTCGDCSDRRKQCDKHNKVKCGTCQAYVSERHIHIDYVGHADVTSRLLEVDPEWNWDPKAEDERGMPVFDLDEHGNPVGMWIKLTVGGVTRLGYGSVPSGQPDAVKVLIGDALRNAAMRFGVALDLWAKGDRADPTAENATASAGQAARRSGGSQSAADAFENAAPARPRQNRNEGNGRQPQRQAERPVAAAPEGGAGSTWLAASRRIIPDIGLDACQKMRREAIEKGRSGAEPPDDVNKVLDLLKARMEALANPPKGAAAPPVAAALKPDDPWATAFRGAVDAVEAERLLDDLRDQAGRGEIDPGRKGLVEELAEELFPGITTMTVKDAA